MGNKSSRIKPINTECPICYTTKTDMILLDCGHCFDYYCLQRACLEYINNNIEQTCPFCRTIISVKKLKLLYNNWLIESFKPTDWVQYNTQSVMSNLKITKYNKIDMHNENDEFLYYIIIPYYKHKNMNKPLFFHSPLISRIEYAEDSILYDLKFNNEYICAIDCYIYNSRAWNNFIHTNFSILKNQLTHIGSQINSSYIKMRLFIKNYNDIVVYNEQEGTYRKGFYLLPQKCICLFRMYLIENTTDLYLINELYGILYK